MKKKLLSLFLALSMLLTSVLCLLPVAAEGDTEDPTDTAQRAAGKVCRVGTVAEASASDYAGYYDNVNTAVSAALSNGKTVTLIDNATLTSNIVIGSNNLTLEGNDKTLTVSGFIRNNGTGTISVKSLTVKTAEKMDKELFVLANTGTLTIENCTFQITADSTLTDKIFSLNSGNGGLVNLTDCVFSIDAKSKFATTANAAVFAQYNDCTPTVNLDNTPIDISAFSSMVLSKAGTKGLRTAFNIRNQSNITTATSIKNTKVTIDNSSMVNVATDGILFDYSGCGTEVTFSAKNATLNAKKYAFSITGCKAAVNVSLDGTTVVDGANRAFSVTKNTNAVNITASGNTEIRSAAGEENAIYVCGQPKKNGNDLIDGDFSAESFTLTLKDNSKLISSGDVISFSHGSNWINKATITAVGNVTITAGTDKSLIVTCGGLGNGAIKYIESDNVNFDEDKWTTDLTKTTKISVPAPKMQDGASVRLVEGSSGLRFSSTLANLAEDATVKFVRNGTLIAIHSELGTNDFTIAALEAAGIEFANIVATEEGTVAGDGFNTYNAALTNIPDDYCSVDFAARAYAVYEINGVEYYVYTDYNEDTNVRNFYEICESALADTLSSSDPNYTKAGYPYQIAGGGKTSGAPILLRSVNCSKRSWQKKTDDRNHNPLATI